jgi:hypothetical protein
MAYPDFEEFIAELNAHGVKYLVVGAHALAHHARAAADERQSASCRFLEIEEARRLAPCGSQMSQSLLPEKNGHTLCPTTPSPNLLGDGAVC